MKRTTLLAIPIAMALFLFPLDLLAQNLGRSAGYNLDYLWDEAQSNFDLNEEDAVLLLESHQLSFGSDGTRQTRVHRVVWIGTEVGIRSYADLRIPWNSATSTLEVEILRTWMDGRWWPDAEKISDTAVVHTLPHALDKADDYTTMRETMLLHDGVELGCIMETAYTITDANIPADGGVFVFPQRDPAVTVEFRIMAPPGVTIRYEEQNGVEAPEDMLPTKGQGYRWYAERIPALKQPIASSPEMYEPAVVWSTWENWDQLANHWMDAFNKGMKLEATQVEGLNEIFNPTMSEHQKLMAIAGHLNTMVRGVRYSADFWLYGPRSAARTLATAYGHDLDRAILAGAFLKEAGIAAEPLLIGNGAAWVARELPRLQGLERVTLRIPGVTSTVLDSHSGQVQAFDQVYGHPYWFIGGHAGGGVHPPVLPQPNKAFTVGVNLSANDEGGFIGEGFFRGQAQFSQFSSLMSQRDLTQGVLSSMTGALLEGSTIQNATPVLFREDLVEVNFGLELPVIEADASGRQTLLVGQPGGGVLDKLPQNVQLYEQHRQSPVLGLNGWKQEIAVRVELKDVEILHLPAAFKLENSVGSFSLDVHENDGWVTLTRTLSLTHDDLMPSDWPALRALLLEEADQNHGRIVWK